MSVQIHGKEYITVAERLVLAKDDIVSVKTEVLYQSPVVIKATVIVRKFIKGDTMREPERMFTGISAANPNKTLEKQSPYEIAETSAVGRALAFAGYGVTKGIASAEEIKKVDPTDEWPIEDTGEGCTCGTKGLYHSKSCPMFKGGETK